MRILIIDDEECIRESFRIYLEGLGHEVITAETPSVCSAFENHDCDKDEPCGHVLFIDEVMPKTSGLSFVEEMASRGCKGALNNTFVMTGNINLADIDKAEKLGCKLLQKPIIFAEIDKLLKECMLNIHPEESEENSSNDLAALASQTQSVRRKPATCNLSIRCIYYNMHRRKTSIIRSELLITSYCEGPLESKCRRKQCVDKFRRVVPDNMAPNGFIVGTKIYIDKFRNHRRYAVRSGACKLQDTSSGKTFDTEVIDISTGGIRLFTKADPRTMRNASNEAIYKIMKHSLEKTPVSLSKEFIKVVWQNNQVLGCLFVSSAA